MPLPLHFSLFDPEIQAVKSNRARILDEERKPRFFDPKRRQIGVDVEALNRQVREKIGDKAHEIHLAKQFNAYSDLLFREEEEVKKRELINKREAAQRLIDYRCINQRKEQRREFDLNDPQYLCKSLPMCCGDKDPRIKSKGSLLRFDGEDYDGLRAKKKLLKLKQVLEEQIEESNNLKTSMKLADKEWTKDWLLDNDLYKQCMDIEERAKRNEIVGITEFNVILGKINKIKTMNEKKVNDAEVLSHMYNVMTSDFFVPNASANPLGINRIDSNSYKGLNSQDLYRIKSFQKEQMEEKIKSNEAEEAFNDYYYNLENKRIHEEQKLCEKLQTQKKDELQKIKDINLILAKEQNQRRKKINREAHDNIPSEEFYAQFNKTTK